VDRRHARRARRGTGAPFGDHADRGAHVDIDVEAEHWDAARVRLHEATTHRMGRDLLVAAARHRASGELVGYSELTVSRDQPQTAYQWTRWSFVATGVTDSRSLESGDHATTRVRQYPTRKITTFNSMLNEPMIAVNEALGLVSPAPWCVAQGPLGLDLPRAFDDHLAHLGEIHVVRTDPAQEPVDRPSPTVRDRRR